MLIGFIKHNRAISIVLLPIALICLWVYGFIHPIAPLTEHAAPLYKLLTAGIAQYPLLLTLISFLLVFCGAVLINHLVERNEIVATQTYLPALVYVVLMSLQPEMFSLHPIVIANLLMLFALNKLMQTYRKETAYAEAFDTGFLISIASLFYIPSGIFILLLWIGLLIIRPFIWREWIISLIGLILPWTFLVFYYFWNNTLDALKYEVFYYTNIAPRKSFSVFVFSYYEYLQMTLLMVAVFFSAGRFLKDLSKSTVQSRSNLLLMLYFLILGFASIFIAPSYSTIYLSFLAIPFSIFFSSFLLFAKKEWIAEILFLLLILSNFVNQFF
ncbi:MAG: hypothetical protein HY840_13555 [Bacteroidetes bacterium]|nr:hypothetical protein [Bacteroidota bacterium]